MFKLFEPNETPPIRLAEPVKPLDAFGVSAGLKLAPIRLVELLKPLPTLVA